MKTMLLILLPLLFSGATFASESVYQFTYEPNDGSAPTKCTYVQSKDSPYDKVVSCQTDKKQKPRIFNAHLAISKYNHANVPTGAAKVSYEILYWVDGNGATTSLNFVDDTKLLDLNSSQSITGEDSSLRLKLKLATSEIETSLVAH